jgi:hypothetical protein
MRLSLIPFRAIIGDACEHSHLRLVDTKGNIACLAGYVAIWTNFWENCLFFAQLPSLLSEEIAHYPRKPYWSTTVVPFPNHAMTAKPGL